MINFYNTRIVNDNCEPNTWYEYNGMHYFKMPVTFHSSIHGTTLKVQDTSGKSYSETGHFLPDEDFSMYFVTDLSNQSIELVTMLYSSYDVFCMEQDIVSLYFYYKIPWYFIPKNYLDFEPRHLIMMFNMGYLMQNNPNNTNISSQYYNKYYHGIDATSKDIEDVYSKYILDKFSLDNVIVKDFLNL